jgi:hypothetical protein
MNTKQLQLFYFVSYEDMAGYRVQATSATKALKLLESCIDSKRMNLVQVSHLGFEFIFHRNVDSGIEEYFQNPNPEKLPPKDVKASFELGDTYITDFGHSPTTEIHCVNSYLDSRGKPSTWNGRIQIYGSMEFVHEVLKKLNT